MCRVQTQMKVHSCPRHAFAQPHTYTHSIFQLSYSNNHTLCVSWSISNNSADLLGEPLSPGSELL